MIDPYRVLSSDEFWAFAQKSIDSCKRAAAKETDNELREMFLRSYLYFAPCLGAA